MEGRREDGRGGERRGEEGRGEVASWRGPGSNSVYSQLNLIK